MPIDQYHLKFANQFNTETSVISSVDPRDYIATNIMATLPAVVDFRANGWVHPVYNQLSLGSCVANSTCNCAYILAKKLNIPLEPSRLFQYFNNRVERRQTNADGGSGMRVGPKMLAKFGASEEELFPYDTNKYAVKPPYASYKKALKLPNLVFRRCESIETIKTALANGYPLAISIPVTWEPAAGNQFSQANGVLPNPPIGTLGPTNHSITVIGYNDNTQRFTAVNSWGAGWADNGFCYIPYQFYIDHANTMEWWSLEA